MSTSPHPHVLTRLLMVKQLAAQIPSLTPTSDALSVARAILTAHDAVDLALATIVDHLQIAPMRDRNVFMMTNAAEIQKRGPLAGYSYLGQLNEERNSFKHKGSLPNPQQWHRVGSELRAYIDEWCRSYVGMALSDIELDVLIENEEARLLYLEAKAKYHERDYKSALERLGEALYVLLENVPGVPSPTVGSENVTHALRLAAFGVNAGDFLTLQELLPSVMRLSKDTRFISKWTTRGTGNPANWDEWNVRFSLDAFVDIAIKIQHAPWVPWPVDYYVVYIDTATAKHDDATVWSFPDPLDVSRWGPPQPRMKLKKGEVLRAALQPIADPRAKRGTLGALFSPSFETATAFQAYIDGAWGVLYTDDFEISSELRDLERTRRLFPHLVEGGE